MSIYISNDRVHENGIPTLHRAIGGKTCGECGSKINAGEFYLKAKSTKTCIECVRVISKEEEKELLEELKNDD